MLFIHSRYLGATAAKFIFINTTDESSVGWTCQSSRLEPDYYRLIWEEITSRHPCLRSWPTCRKLCSCHSFPVESSVMRRRLCYFLWKYFLRPVCWKLNHKSILSETAQEKTVKAIQSKGKYKDVHLGLRQIRLVLSWWRHQMETFSALLAIRAGNLSVTGDFPTERPVTRSFDVFLSAAE